MYGRSKRIAQIIKFKPDLLKCDIEGYEYETFLGAESFLREHKPRIHLELHNQILKNRGKDPTDLIRMFNSLGYVERVDL